MIENGTLLYVFEHAQIANAISPQLKQPQNRDPEIETIPPPDALPQNPNSTLKSGIEDIKSRFSKTLAAAPGLSNTLNTMASAYKNWLLELLERLDELAADPDEVALQGFKSVIQDELTKHRENQIKSQFPDDEETNTQFRERMVLKFSTDPMIKILESALREIRDWESHKTTVEAAAVVRKIRTILTEGEE